MADVPGEPMVIPSGPIFLRDRAAIGRLLLERHIPSIGAFREIVEAGVAMSYGIDLAGLFRDVADVVDQIAKGAQPADVRGAQGPCGSTLCRCRLARDHQPDSYQYFGAGRAT